MKEPRFNVYIHSDYSNKPFYVGSGNFYRPKTKANRSKKWKEKAEKGYYINIIADNLTKEDSLELEDLVINLIGYDNLVNKGQFNNKNSAKKIIDISTGIIYLGTKELCDKLNIGYSSVSKKLSGHIKNNTTFKYL